MGLQTKLARIMRPSASADHFRFLDLAPVVSAETNKSNTKFGAERSSGPQTKNRPKIACCAQLSATSKRSQKNSGSVGKTPHVKMTSPWFDPNLGFAFFSKVSFWVEFWRDALNLAMALDTLDGQTDTPCLSARDAQRPPFFSLRLGISIDKSVPRVREFEIFRMSIRT